MEKSVNHVIVIQHERASDGLAVYGIPLVERLVRQAAEQKFDSIWIVTDSPDRLPPIQAKREYRVVSEKEFVSAATSISDHDVFYFVGSAAIVDDRLFGFLKKTPRDTVVKTADDDPALIRLNGNTVRPYIVPLATYEDMKKLLPDLKDVQTQKPSDFDPYVDDLRLRNEPYLFRCTNESFIPSMENRMFEANFKGTLDFIAIYIYKYPVREMVRFLGRFRWITPNQVTFLSIVSSFAVPTLFALGHMGWAIAVGWSMFILDSVDGKLARLTVRLSRTAGILEHATSTPAVFLWFPTLGWHLSNGALLDFSNSITAATWTLMPLYWIDKSVNGLFRKRHKIDLYNWSVFDEKFHLIACRRAIIMLIVTIGYATNYTKQSFIALAVWMVVSFLVHVFRSAMIHTGSTKPRLSQ